MDKPTIWLWLAAIGIVAYSVIGYSLANAERPVIGHMQIEKSRAARLPEWVQKPAAGEHRI